MRPRTFALSLAFSSLLCGATAVSDKPDTPFKLATFEAQGKTRVGMALGDHMLDLNGANAYVEKQAGLPAHYSPHSFRATGITNFLENDGTLEAAQRIAGHADSRTTKLYDRRGQKVLLEDMERIRY